MASVLLPLPHNGAILNLPSICPFSNMTGIPCPGCGLTRSFVCCGHGHLVEAFHWHPLGPVLFAATLIYAVGSLANIRVTLRNPILLISLSAAVMFIFWLLRLGGIFPIPVA